MHMRTLYATPMASFGRVSRYVGVNDNIRQERRQQRKYGMKRHFYDQYNFDPSEMPKDQ